MAVYIIISSIVALLIGGLLTWLSMRFLLKSKYDSVLREAEKEAEVIKKNKLLEVKEKFLHLKADLEKQVSARNAKIQSAEGKLKQRELTLNQRQEDLQRKNCEIDAVKENLANQLELVDREKAGFGKTSSERDRTVGSSFRSFCRRSKRTFDRIVERRSQIGSLLLIINEIMEEAKMTANKEAKNVSLSSLSSVLRLKRRSKTQSLYSISNRTRSKAASSVVKVVTSAHWKLLPVLRSWWTIRLKQSCFPDSILSVVK